MRRNNQLTIIAVVAVMVIAIGAIVIASNPTLFGAAGVDEIAQEATNPVPPTMVIPPTLPPDDQGPPPEEQAQQPPAPPSPTPYDVPPTVTINVPARLTNTPVPGQPPAEQPSGEQPSGEQPQATQPPAAQPTTVPPTATPLPQIAPDGGSVEIREGYTISELAVYLSNLYGYEITVEEIE